MKISLVGSFIFIKDYSLFKESEKLIIKIKKAFLKHSHVKINNIKKAKIIDFLRISDSNFLFNGHISFIQKAFQSYLNGIPMKQLENFMDINHPQD